MAEADGVGLQFPTEFGVLGFDLDHVVTEGIIEPWAMEVVEILGSYTEYSMSGTGLHVFVGGVKPEGYRKKVGQVECFSHGGVQIVPTGEILHGFDTLTENQDGVNEILERYLTSAPEVAQRSAGFAAPAPRVDDIDIAKRARAYIAAMPNSISGQNGHVALWNVAQILTRGFALPDYLAHMILQEFNAMKCEPPWSEKDLCHKMQDALKNGQMVMGCKLQDDFRDANSALSEVDGEVQEDVDNDTISLDECVEAFHQGLESGAYVRISTGIYELDYALRGGIRAGELVVIQGRPSHGKTAIALHIQESFLHAGYHVLFVSKEMSIHGVGQRIMQRLAGEEPTQSMVQQSRELWKQHRPDYMQHGRVAFKARDIKNIIEIVHKAQQRHGSQVVIVDYLQLLSQSGAGTHYEKMTEVSLQLANLRQDGLTVIVLSQMNRSIESREHFSPKGSDARDTGQIEQDADIHLSVVWKKMARDKSGRPQFPNAKDDEFKIYIHKNRLSGIAADEIECRYDPYAQQFNMPQQVDPETPKPAPTPPPKQTRYSFPGYEPQDREDGEF